MFIIIIIIIFYYYYFFITPPLNNNHSPLFKCTVWVKVVFCSCYTVVCVVTCVFSRRGCVKDGAREGDNCASDLLK